MLCVVTASTIAMNFEFCTYAACMQVVSDLTTITIYCTRVYLTTITKRPYKHSEFYCHM